MILYNGKIYTPEGFSQAMCIENGIIKNIGTNEEVNNYNMNHTKIDLKGRLVVPGFIDSHMHLLNYAISKTRLDLTHAKSIDEVISLGKNFIKDHPQGFVAFGYNHELFSEKRLITKYDLDQISKEVPIIVKRVCGHIASVNSAVLISANIFKNAFVTLGQIDLNGEGEPTGVLREDAMDLINWNDNLTIEKMKALLLVAIKDANAVGLTSIATNDINRDFETNETVYEAFSQLLQEELLHVRINHQITSTNKKVLNHFFEKPNQSNHIKVGPLKLFMDGSLGGKTALLKENYLHDSQKGILCLDLNVLDELLAFCKQNKRQVIIHAIGNKAVDLCLDHFLKFQDEENSLRWGIVHAQITDQDVLDKMKRQHICAFVQPPFVISDMNLVTNRVSKELVSSSYVFKTLSQNVPTGFGSDSPVEDFNPLIGIYAMVTRANWDYNQFYNLKEKQSVSEALDGYTKHNAYLTFEETFKGQIKKGFLGDVVVLSEDIFTMNEEAIKNVKVDCTIVGGEIVYMREKNHA